MKRLILWRFCGDKRTHEEHWIHIGARNVAGAADYCCVGYMPAEISNRKDK